MGLTQAVTHPLLRDEKERWGCIRKKLVLAGLLEEETQHDPGALFIAIQRAADAAERETHRTDADKASDRARLFLLSQMDDVNVPSAERREAARLLLGEK